MIDLKTIPDLYSITGDIKDIHRMVVPKRLLDRLEAAEKDAARLNWLEQNLFNRENIDPFTKKPCTKFNMWVLFSPVGTRGSARTIIDKAMKEQEK